VTTPIISPSRSTTGISLRCWEMKQSMAALSVSLSRSTVKSSRIMSAAHT
jgi:hypothetical protein